ncbi:MAG: YcxB family protein [Saprospiraceae bacterium]
MHLKTKIIESSSSEIFRIYLKQYIQRQLLLVVLLVGLLILNIIQFDVRGYLPLGFLIVICSLVVLNFFRVFKTKNVQDTLKIPQFEIENDKLYAIFNPEKKQKREIPRIFKWYKMKDYFLVYFSKNKFFYIPFRAFENEAAITFFEKKLIGMMNAK